MAESYTTPHSLPIQGTADLVRSPSGDNIRKQLNAVSTAANTAITNEGVRAEGAAKSYADGKFIPVWSANTAYTAGQRVVAPNGDIVAAKAEFTSGAAYAATNWTPSRDTGWRSIATINAASGTVHLRRQGNFVTARTNSILLTAGGGQTSYAVLPAGFKGSSTNVFGWVANPTNNTALQRIQVENNGLAWIGDFTGTKTTRPTFAMEGELSWVTDDDWPTTLPGTAV